jgi:DNA-binding phage protein
VRGRKPLLESEKLAPKGERFTSIAISRVTRSILQQLQNDLYHEDWHHHSADSVIRAAVKSYRKERSLKAIASKGSLDREDLQKAIGPDSDGSGDQGAE